MQRLRGFLVAAISIPVRLSGFLKLSTRFNTTRLATRAIPAINIHISIYIVVLLPIACTVANMNKYSVSFGFIVGFCLGFSLLPGIFNAGQGKPFLSAVGESL